MFSIPDKIDEFRVICFIFSTFAKSFSVAYRCFHCKSVWLTISVYGSDFPNDANIIKYLLVAAFNKCGMKVFLKRYPISGREAANFVL